jgi:hypothetical protein
MGERGLWAGSGRRRGGGGVFAIGNAQGRKDKDRNEGEDVGYVLRGT